MGDSAIVSAESLILLILDNNLFLYVVIVSSKRLTQTAVKGQRNLF